MFHSRLDATFSMNGNSIACFYIPFCFQYITEDLSGNKASCIFYVTVLGKSDYVKFSKNRIEKLVGVGRCYAEPHGYSFSISMPSLS